MLVLGSIAVGSALVAATGYYYYSYPTPEETPEKKPKKLPILTKGRPKRQVRRPIKRNPSKPPVPKIMGNPVEKSKVEK